MVAQPPYGIELRQTIRIRRSSLLDAKLDKLDRPSLKVAETLDEFVQAFTLLHNVYRKSGYLEQEDASGLHFGIHNLLPKTCVFIFKSYKKVLATMMFVPDTPEFGLPMDELYREEVDGLRRQGRKIAEIGSLVTRLDRRGQNIIMFLAKAIFQYAMITSTDDLCIAVNPKHVNFYRSIFLFEPLGEQRFYNKVGAPAVALRADMRRIGSALRDTYGQEDFDTNLHAFFTRLNAHSLATGLYNLSAEKRDPLDHEVLAYLLASRPAVLDGITPAQRDFFRSCYPGCEALFDVAAPSGKAMP